MSRRWSLVPECLLICAVVLFAGPPAAAQGEPAMPEPEPAEVSSVDPWELAGPSPEWGTADASFNYPNDIAIDTTGRLYIADRENDRIQVWSY